MDGGHTAGCKLVTLETLGVRLSPFPQGFIFCNFMQGEKVRKLIIALMIFSAPLYAVTKKTTIPDLLYTANLFSVPILSTHEVRYGDITLFFDGDIFTLERGTRYITFVEFKHGKVIRGGWYVRKSHWDGEEESLRITNF